MHAHARVRIRANAHVEARRRNPEAGSKTPPLCCWFCFVGSLRGVAMLALPLLCRTSLGGRLLGAGKPTLNHGFPRMRETLHRAHSHRAFRRPASSVCGPPDSMDLSVSRWKHAMEDTVWGVGGQRSGLKFDWNAGRPNLPFHPRAMLPPNCPPPLST
jgi:hypothetical protein